MTARGILILAALAALAAALSMGAGAQDQDTAAAAQAAMMKAAIPGPVHAFLAEKAGSWTVMVSMWGRPDAEPMVSTVASRSEMVMNCKYAQAGDPLETTGWMIDPATGNEIVMRSATTWKDKDAFHVTTAGAPGARPRPGRWRWSTSGCGDLTDRVAAVPELLYASRQVRRLALAAHRSGVTPEVSMVDPRRSSYCISFHHVLHRL